MKILFDNQIFVNQKFGGISRYFAEVMYGIKKANLEVKPNKYFTDNFNLQQKALSRLNFFYNSDYFRGKSRLFKLLQEYQNSQIFKDLKKGNFDVFHPTYYNPKFLDYKPKDKPFVLTVHDMTHEVILDSFHGKTHKETLGKRILIPEADHIIAVSEHTKSDILKIFPSINEQKISVIYHGNSLVNCLEKQHLVTDNSYILYVGLRNTYKNFDWFLSSISSYLIQNNLNLICAGGDIFTAKETSQIAELGLDNHVRYTPIKNDAMLCSVYQNALALVIPSLYEGFGIPILEAFSCGCPVLLNKTSSLPEIGGSGAIYFNPDTQGSLIDGLKKISEPIIRTGLKASGKAELKRFSWERSVQEHLNIYKQFE